MPVTLNGVRKLFYVLLWIVVVLLMFLCATRIHYTAVPRLPTPLDSGTPFYEPVVVALTVIALLALFWCCFVIHTLHKGSHYGRVSTFAFELLGLSVFTIAFVTSAAVISTSWPTLFKPAAAQQRHVLIALLAFACVASTLALSLLATSAIFVLSKSALAHPLHARYDQHASC